MAIFRIRSHPDILVFHFSFFLSNLKYIEIKIMTFYTYLCVCVCVGACVCVCMNRYVFGVGDVVDEYVNSVVCVWEEGRGALMSQGLKV